MVCPACPPRIPKNRFIIAFKKMGRYYCWSCINGLDDTQIRNWMTWRNCFFGIGMDWEWRDSELIQRSGLNMPTTTLISQEIWDLSEKVDLHERNGDRTFSRWASEISFTTSKSSQISRFTSDLVVSFFHVDKTNHPSVITMFMVTRILTTL